MRYVQDVVVPRGVGFGLSLGQIASALGLERCELDVVLIAVERRDLRIAAYLATTDLAVRPARG